MIPSFFSHVIHHAPISVINEIRRFCNLTHSSKHYFSKGGNLTELVKLAQKIDSFIVFHYTVRPSEQSAEALLRTNELEMNRIQCVQHLRDSVSNAIQQKKVYYQTHWLGKITQFVLNLLCSWQNGKTAAISFAEDYAASRKSYTDQALDHLRDKLEITDLQTTIEERAHELHRAWLDRHLHIIATPPQS